MLNWNSEIGVGYLPLVGNAPYDTSYFSRYAAYEGSETCIRLNAFRCSLVERYAESVVDIGIGAGTFVAERLSRGHEVRGFDINPAGVKGLLDRGLYVNPYESDVDAITCWDVLEHVPEFWDLIDRVRRHVFVSIPVFRDADHARSSKHFRPAEHCWYFTQRGIERVFQAFGFRVIEVSDEESRIGREDILTFTFERVA